MIRFKGAAEGVSHSVKLFWSLSDSFSPFPTISNFSHIPPPHQLPSQAATPPPLPLPPHSPKLEFIVSVVSDPVIMQHSPSFLWLWSFGETPSFPSDQKCTEAQNEQSCAFEQKERQILFCEWKNCLLYIGGEVEVHEGGEGLMVEKKMVERVVLRRRRRGRRWRRRRWLVQIVISILLARGLSPDIIYPSICRISNVKTIWLMNFKLLHCQLQTYKFSNSPLAAIFRFSDPCHIIGTPSWIINEALFFLFQ